ncbi:hypothetical protein SmJEL517_g02012 [Synchytrium microbalum]|uniref:SMP-30/Gluconolactonase/LRE-like region domain-containing protein n=1 Tax=Synchytrium microbalum TaxID=1806994 RepID=A0A507C2F1_9FUNG|nr:uncharacterized protein SmJEL517_g02012 [Synchytrium microbalum]TPX35690.1 hypothetical protein SmJEL517_g02012 [Synchytrium microbalum]
MSTKPGVPPTTTRSQPPIGINIINPVANKLLPATATLSPLATQALTFTEGPVYLPRLNRLAFVDIPAAAIMSSDLSAASPSPRASVITYSSNHSNGMFRSKIASEKVSEGEVILVCEGGGRRVVRLTLDKNASVVKREVIADNYKGVPLNSPNDIIEKSDGTIFFTDPNYGCESLTGHVYPAQMPNRVYMVNPNTKEISIADDCCVGPNGLTLSPDEKLLYIADSGGYTRDKFKSEIRLSKLNADGTVQPSELFVRVKPGVPDGIRCDTLGNIWSSAGDGVHIYSPSGELIAKIHVGLQPANLCFGGKNYDELFITARHQVWRVTGLGVRGKP